MTPSAPESKPETAADTSAAPDTAVHPFQHPGGMIRLENPERRHFASYIFGNALHCDAVVERQSNVGETVVICGAGPSLCETAAKWCPRGTQVWGCNSAAIWLYEQGHPITHAFTVDQTPQMVVEWLSAPDLTYLLASTVHPHLTDYLVERKRRLVWFHNFVGVDDAGPVQYAACTVCRWMGDLGTPACPQCGGATAGHVASYEEWLYSAFYPTTVVVGSGLNAVTRAIDLALFMGFAKIIVLGADCSLRTTAPPPDAPVGSPPHIEWLRNHSVMHADGGHALASEASHLTFDATLCQDCGAKAGHGATACARCGSERLRFWLTKPDLIVTAVWLVRMKRLLGSRLAIMGDTLPKALLHWPDDQLARLPTLVTNTGGSVEFCLPDYLLTTAP